MRGNKRIHRVLTVRTATILALVALVLGVAGVVYAESGTVAVTGGTLSVTPANVTLSGVTLDGADKTAISTSNAWTAKDPTGTGAGWRLTIASTDFTTDKIQRVDIGTSTAGTFTLTYSATTTAAIAFDATAAEVETAIEALSNVTAATVTGTGASATPWVIRFDTSSGSGVMTSTDSLTDGSSTVALETIDISEADQQLQITLADAEAADAGIGVTAGNTKPASSVTSQTDIADSTVTFLSAATDTGMGEYTLNPDFELEVRAEVLAATYTATITVATVSGP